MDMFEQALKEAHDKLNAQIAKKSIDMLLDMFDEDSQALARTFLYALVDNGCPPEAIFKALTTAANRG